ncbi:lysophospholipid acyltransferase family protein [Synechocystis sp. LKSZ1]|uniref:lysophospholipid acyltransferase family protein n=1 Tax=Synechocystis sp. LKSZ1 TaxID=3144951 RepID=UPI00336BEA83
MMPKNPVPYSGWSLTERDPETIAALMPAWEWFYRYYFRVQTGGWENIPEGRVLFVGSHNGGLTAPDMVMMIYDWFRHQGLERPIYGLMHPTVWKMSPSLAELAVKVGAIQAHPKMALAALHKGASVLVYPGGAQDVYRPFSQRHQIYFAGRKGFIKVALREGVPIVPAISVGAHETFFVMTDCYEQVKFLHELGMPWLLGVDPVVFPVYLGLPWGLALGPLPHWPLPLTMHTRIGRPICFERYGIQAAHDRDYVDACYRLVVARMQADLDQLVAETQTCPLANGFPLSSLLKTPITHE